MGKISKEEIKKLGELAKIELSEEETGEFQKEIAEILDYVDFLKKAETEGVPELIHPLDAVNEFREDKPAKFADKNIFRNGGYIKTKKIFTENEN